MLMEEIKAVAVNDVGNKLEDRFEASKLELSEAKGIRNGFDFAARKLEQLTLALDAGFKENPPKIPEEEYRIAKKYVGQTYTMMVDLGKSAFEQICRMQGKVAALEQAVKLVETMLKVEEAKVKAIKDGVLVDERDGLPGPAPGDATVSPISRKEGQHPGNPLAAMKARALEAPEASPEPAAPPTPAVEAVAELPPPVVEPIAEPAPQPPPKGLKSLPAPKRQMMQRRKK